jgi:hypothetical protein
MRELIVRDDGQLRRIDGAIAAIEARSGGERIRMGSLLTALLSEREELLRISPHLRLRQLARAHAY